MSRNPQDGGSHRPSTTRLIVCAVAVAALVAAAAFVVPWTQNQHQLQSDYEAAQSQYEAGQYLDAELAFEALGDYHDSAAMAQRAADAREQQRYERAAELDDAGEYAQAGQAFAELGDFSDAAERAQRAFDAANAETYAKAGDLAAAGDHAAAAETFFALGDYADAESSAYREQWADIATRGTQAGPVKLGAYRGVDVTWDVALVEAGRALLVTSIPVTVPEGVAPSSYWEGSDMQQWLSGDYASEVLGSDAALMESGAAADGVPFLLTVDETIGYLGDDAQRIGIEWRLSDDPVCDDRASYVYTNATHYNREQGALSKAVGVRPAVWIVLP